MIRIPQAPSRPPLQTPAREQLAAPGSASTPHLPVRRERIDTAAAADPLIPPQHLLSQISWIAPQSPLMHTPCGAEGKAAARPLKSPPPAQTASRLSHR